MEPEATAAADAQPDQGDAASGLGGGEGEESLQLRRCLKSTLDGQTGRLIFHRYVAEVSASAMAVEQLQREGRLDLQRNSTEEVEGWGEEEEEEVADDGGGEEQIVESGEELVQDVQGAIDEVVAPSRTCDTESVKTEDEKCNSSSTSHDDGGEGELERLMDSSVLSSRLQESSSFEQEPGTPPPPQRTLLPNPSLLQEMRSSLVEAQEEATSLLRQIQDDEEGGSEH